MVELVDGSVIAQLGVTDMRLPIQYAFSYPERWAAPLPPLDLARAGRLEFEQPDTDRFPASRWRSARCAATRGLPIVLNAANEVAVAAFLEARLGVHRHSRRHPRRRWTRYERTRRRRGRAAWTMSARSTAGRASSPARRARLR